MLRLFLDGGALITSAVTDATPSKKRLKKLGRALA